jgi:N-acyl-L-homoserine lactone synthetase
MQESLLAEAIFAVRENLTIEMANSPELIREAYRLRHQVYCIENNYEPGNLGLEFDEFDAHSRHVVIRRNSTGEVVGTVRLVLARSGLGQVTFPLQQVCDPTLLRTVPFRTTGEVSRFAISKERRRLDDASLGLMRLALVQGAVRLSAEAGHTHWLAVMEPSLLRLLRASGLHFQPLGPLVSYHGRRQPVCADLGLLLDRMSRECPEVWKFVTGDGRWSGNHVTPPANRMAA